MKQKLQSFVLQAECRLWEKRWVQLMFMFSSSGSADVVGRRLHSAPGLGLSKTPTAEMEHSLHEANAVSASQVATSGSIVLGMGWCVRKELWRDMGGGVGDKAGHRNVGLLEENKIYDWASFE